MPRRGVGRVGDGRSGSQPGGGVPPTRGPPSSDPGASVSHPSAPAGRGTQSLRGSPVFSPCGPVSAESRRPPCLGGPVSFPSLCLVLSENHMYLFEGKDYSKEPSKEDRKSFEQLVNLQKTLSEKTSGEGRLLRSKGSVRATGSGGRTRPSRSRPAGTRTLLGVIHSGMSVSLLKCNSLYPRIRGMWKVGIKTSFNAGEGDPVHLRHP